MIVNEDWEMSTDILYIIEQQMEQEKEFWNYYNNLEGHAESMKFNKMMEEGLILLNN